MSPRAARKPLTRLGASARLMVLAAALSACAPLAPVYQRPAPPVDTRFPPSPSGQAAAMPAPEPAGGSPAWERDWREFFAHDARLRRLIELALAGNRDLRIAALNIELAKTQFALREADRLPSLNAGLSVSRAPTATGGVNRLVSAGGLVPAWEIDLFGRLRDLSDAAAAQLLANTEARSAVQISLVAAVAAAHLNLAADDELIEVARQTLASREESLRLVRLRFQHGAGSELELRSAESLRESAALALVQSRRQRALDENALVLLLGQPLPADLPAALPLEQAGALPALPVGLPSEVLLRRPDIRQAEQQLIAAHANIGAARAAFLPRISLTGSFGTVSGALSGLFQGGTFGWGVAPQLLQPIFDAGRNQANLQQSLVLRDVALAQYERAIQTGFREVADALAGRATLSEQVQFQQRLLQAEAERERLTGLRYRSGAASHLEWLDAQRSLLSARQAMVQVRAQGAQNLTSLYKVLGGGWQAP